MLGMQDSNSLMLRYSKELVKDFVGRWVRMVWQSIEDASDMASQGVDMSM